MRKVCLSLLLPLLMLLAQHGAAWHAIKHSVGGDTSVASQSTGQQDSKAESDKELSADKFCETCLAFAQIAGVAKVDAPALSLLSFNFASAQWATNPVVTAEAPAQRNRGPPYFL
jgi:hypothetical protein